MQMIEAANRLGRKGSYHGKSIHPLAVGSSGHIARHPLVLRCPSIGIPQGDAGNDGESERILTEPAADTLRARVL